ncbi:MAG: hypothetical protein ACRECF_10140 [Methyloceanibacter sp.]
MPILEHIGGGTLVPVKPSERREIIDRYKTGDRVLAEFDRGRSRKQNNAHHAAIAKAFANLPESGRQFDHVDHLRHWCYLRIGFADTFVQVFTDAMTLQDVQKASNFVVGLRRAYKEHGIYTEMRVVPEGIALDIPKSWAFTRAQHRAATRTMDACLDLLVELVPGITREQLVEATRKDAA